MREEDWIPSVDEICAAFHSAVGTKDDAFTQIRKLIVNCYTYRDGAPAPVRDAAESEPLNVWDQCDALRARVAGLERERDELGGAWLATQTMHDESLRELTAARALLAWERERVVMQASKLCRDRAESINRASWRLSKDAQLLDYQRILEAKHLADEIEKLRALAQPRAEQVPP